MTQKASKSNGRASTGTQSAPNRAVYNDRTARDEHRAGDKTAIKI